jgi:hypothetical protein
MLHKVLVKALTKLLHFNALFIIYISFILLEIDTLEFVDLHLFTIYVAKIVFYVIA